MSRKDEIKKMASFVGNSAAHVGVYGEEAVEKEITVYVEVALEMARGRTWNGREIEDFKNSAVRKVSGVIKERIRRGDLGEKEFDLALRGARTYIDKFADEELSRK